MNAAAKPSRTLHRLAAQLRGAAGRAIADYQMISAGDKVMDFRVTAQGQVYVLEANANPNLETAEDFAESARASGVPYAQLLERLMDLGLKYRAQWRASYG